MADAPALIDAEGLGVRRGGRWLIRDVGLSVGAGEVLTVIGPNGGGKTTLVKVLLGIIRPDAGTVRRAAGLRMGYVPQHLHINRALPLSVTRLMTMTQAASGARVRAALEETGVADLMDAPVHGLSGGEMQRVLLARALLRRPDLLVLDEPAQGVDVAGEAALYDIIAALRRQRRISVFMVSHDIHMVMGGTDRVICLNTHVCCTGVPHAVAQDAEYRRLFGARAADAHALYEHHHDHEHDVHGNVIDGPPP
jgi:zinc transport system ATP-binding protein